MATYAANVRRAFSWQETLINRGEHCSADPAQLATIGRDCGHQIRVRCNGRQAVALYTVSEVHDETAATTIRMARAARARLTPEIAETPDEFVAIVDSAVPHPTCTDEEAETNGEFVERLGDDGAATGLAAIAPHGGAIERWTDEQAEHVAARLAAKGVSCWRCKGWGRGGGALRQWHITSRDIHEASFPLLARIIDRGFAYAVAFHGFDKSLATQPDILIGGAAAEALKREIQTAIQYAMVGTGLEVRIATACDDFNGDDPANVVNRLASGNGIQIEQSGPARDDHWAEIADAVAGVYDSKIGCLGIPRY